MNEDQIERLIQSHLDWRTKFLAFAYSGKHDGWTDADTVQDPMACELGKSLCTVELNSHPLWREIIEVHNDFHKEAKSIYDLAIERKYEEVDRCLHPTTSAFVEKTMSLLSLLRRVKTDLHGVK